MSGAKHYRELGKLLLDLQKDMKVLAISIEEMRAFKMGIDKKTLQQLESINSLSGMILSVIRQNFCERCGSLPAWVKETQFAGKFFFCAKCAKLQPDFKSSTSGDTFFWRKLNPSRK